eukprot:7009425-Lingulodinium_polyedra.AAC.1
MGSAPTKQAGARGAVPGGGRATAPWAAVPTRGADASPPGRSQWARAGVAIAALGPHRLGHQGHVAPDLHDGWRQLHR